MTSYDSLLGHLKHHNLKKWLLDGCEQEDANTIREAVNKIPDHRLKRRLARALSKDEE